MKTSADEAISRFRECFKDSEFQYDFAGSDMNMVRCEVTHDDFRLSVWFDVQKQLWGFDMLNGGSKTAQDFDEFEDYLGTYLSIYTVLIPNAKIVADAFEKEMGISTVFDSFSGNRKNGYTIKFRVLGVDAQDVLVQRVPEWYLVRLVVPDDESQRYKVRTEYKYEIVDGNAVPIPTMHMYIRRLKDRYANDSTKKVQRVGENIFSFCIEDLMISAELVFNYTEVRYHITEVGPFDADITVTPDDPYDLCAVYMACKDFYDDSMAGEADDTPKPEVPEEAAPIMEAASAAFEGEDIQDPGGLRQAAEALGEKDAPSDCSPEDEEELAGAFEEDAPQDSTYAASLDHDAAEAMAREEAAASEFASRPFDDGVSGGEGPELPQEHEEQPESSGVVTPQRQEGSMLYGAASLLEDEPKPKASASCKYSIEELDVKSIKRIDDGSGRVQFIVNGNIHIFSSDAVKSAGFPIKRIKEVVSVVEKCGIVMTADEVNLRRYADEEVDTEELLGRIISAIFD